VLEIVGLWGESIVVVVHFMFAPATDSNLLGLPVSGEEDDGFRLVLGLEVENRGHTGSQTLDNMFMARVVEERHGPAAVADRYHWSAHD